MIISSELTGKKYKTVNECLADEKEFKRKEEELKKAEKEYEEKLAKAFKKAEDACNEFFELAETDVTVDFSIHNAYEEDVVDAFVNALFR